MGDVIQFPIQPVRSTLSDEEITTLANDKAKFDAIWEAVQAKKKLAEQTDHE